MMKAKLFLAVTVVLLSLVSGLEAKSLIISYPTPSWNAALPLAVAQKLGFFAAEGFDVKAVYVRGGPTAMAALISRNADYGVIAGIPAVTSIARGAPVVIVSGYSAYVEYTLIGARGISSVADLRGKVVGVTGPGGIAEFATVEALARKGLHRNKDFTILYAGNSPARVNALEAGKIHAAPFSTSERVALEQRGFPVIFHIGEMIPDFPFLVVVTSKQKVEQEPEEVVRVLRAINASMGLIRLDKAKAISAALQTGIPGDPAIEQIAINYYINGYSISIGEKNIRALISGARLEEEARKIGGVEKFFISTFAKNALNN